MTLPWSTSTVGEQFDVQLGKMLDAAKNFGVPKPYLGNRAVQWGRIDLSAVGVVPLTTADLQRFRLRSGDLLVCEGGEVGRAAIWRDELPECYFQKALHRLRAKSGYDARLMLAFLEYWSTVGEFADYATQTSIAHLPRERFIQMPLPVPTVAEQRFIGDVLEDAEGVIASIQRLIVKKQAIKQGMAQQLLSGRTRLPSFSGEWATRRVGEFARVVAGGTPNTNVARYWGGTIRWMSSGELHKKRVANVAGRITDAGLSESSAHLLPPGSVLIGLAGQGKTRGTVAISEVELATNQSIAAIFPSNEHDPDFLFQNLDGRYEELRSMSTGGSGRGGLNLTIIRSVEVLMPDRDEQHAIASVLSDADAEIDALKLRLEKAKAIKQGMAQQLLTGKTRLPVLEAVA